nr:calpain-9-like [Leptinotarsa decemlineata]
MPQTASRGPIHHHNGHVGSGGQNGFGPSSFNGHTGHNGQSGHNCHSAHNGYIGHSGYNAHSSNNGQASHFQQNGHLKNNGHAGANGSARAYLNGHAVKPEDKQSTLSRYCTSDRHKVSSNYHAIRRSCRERGSLFEDTEFPAGPKALYHHKKPPLHPIIWMRPHEMCQRPRFMGEPAEEINKTFTVESGELGDQWLLAAVASLALTPKFLDRVVPPEQGFDTVHSYCGAFRFRFWHFGEWKDVIVDDKLPTYKGRLVHLHSSNNTEYWIALLEKAYAKFYGCYEQLSFGSTTRALQDLTGGIVQSFGLTHQDRFLTFQVLNSAVPRSSLLIATITQEKDNKRHLRLRNGLITQHAYSVTGLARVRGVSGEVPLVRLRNPWARGEWTGPWSERSWEWDGLSNRDKELLSVRVTNDGEFWMSFEDFSRHFTQLDLVHIGPDDWMMEGALHSKQPWRAVLARRRWRSGYNAGGGPTYVDTTSMNPQFHVQIPRTTTNKCHVVVSITQYYETNVIDVKKKRALYAIGFAVYEVPHSMQRLTPHFVTEQVGFYEEVNEDNMIIRNIASEFVDDSSPVSSDGKSVITKLLVKYPPEVDASQLQKILKAHWKAYLSEKPSLELCKSLIMLRDFNISGRINLMDIPILMHMLQYWRLAFQKFERSHNCGKTSSYHLRALLWEAGCTVSNKVLECLVLRFAKNRILTTENYIMALVRLHLSHERYHNLDTKMKGNPISLEEVSFLQNF